VAIDHKSHLIDDVQPETTSAIENELPAYRAISARAVFSVVCGVLAICSFAHLYFVFFAVLAVLFGVSANRAIKRYPDVLTGRGLANAGIALGLIFGLTSFTVLSVQDFIRTREAAKFARQYAEVLKTGTLGEVLWYNLHPEIRKSKTPEQVSHEYESVQAKDKMMMEQKTAPFRQLRKRLASSKDESIRFVDIEGQGVEESHSAEIDLYSLAKFEIEGPASPDFPEKKEFALAIMKSRLNGRKFEWWVQDLRYPYLPKTYVPVAKPADDGHGHAH